jgi:hypothetical protein
MACVRTGSGCREMMLVLVPVIRAGRCVPVLLVDVMYLCTYQWYKYHGSLVVHV